MFGFAILALSLVLMFAAFFRTRAAIGFIALGILADVLAFLNLFISLSNQNRNALAATVAVICGIVFVVLLILFIREYGKLLKK